MKPLALLLIVLAFALTACGSASDVTNLITSTPDAAALQVAEANLTAASTSVEAYHAVHGSYEGVTLTPSFGSPISIVASATGYCLQTVVRDVTASLHGPGGSPQAGPCT